jgi:tetratricopeptide (TPR) repeat protein
VPGADRGGSGSGGKGKNLHPVPFGKINWVYSKPTPRVVISGSGVKEKKKKRIQPFEYIFEFSKAREKSLPVIVYFYCGNKKLREAKYCHKLNAKVFTSDAVVKESRKFLCIAIETVKLHKTIKLAFRAKRTPLIIFMDCYGKVISRHASCYSMSPATFEKNMKRVRRRNDLAVKKQKIIVARQKKAAEKIKADFDEADKLMDKGCFEKAKAIFEKISTNQLDKDLADWAKLRIQEIGTGVVYFEAVKAYEAGLFDDAEKKLHAVARSNSERYANRAANLLDELPAARLFREAENDKKAGRNYPAMQKLEKIIALDSAGRYRDKARRMLRKLGACFGPSGPPGAKSRHTPYSYTFVRKGGLPRPPL